jgi:L-aspartate oxidase
MKTDLLIIGSGIAGCAAALAAADAGLDVLIITKTRDPRRSTATSWAQGGIIYRGEGDSPDLLAADIFSAGADVGYEPAIRQLAEMGPGLVEEILLDRLGVPFDRSPDQELDITEEGAHSVRRIIHVADLTGHAIEENFVTALEKMPTVKFLTDATVVDLLTLSHHSLEPADTYRHPTCVGANVFLQQTGEVVSVLAAETLLATGGLGQLFLHTTNPRTARGDGIAMAYRAGARLLNLEYVQFHPTALYQSDTSVSGNADGESFLISESMRGEGGRLTLPDGNEFMAKYHERGSLAPRDVVARAIHTEMLENKLPCVYLDITDRPADWVRQRFPHIHRKCLEAGIDITRQPIPVVPAAHYSCGGVAVDLEGRTSIARLRAAGEVSCTGVHGANRLASTSLLEGLVWGIRAGRSVAADIARTARDQFYYPHIEPWRYESELVDPALVLQDWLTIKYTMWNYVGLVRSTKRMRRARSILRELQVEIEYFYERARLSDEVIGLRNGCQAALAVLFAAVENRHSHGAHFRVD